MPEQSASKTFIWINYIMIMLSYGKWLSCAHLHVAQHQPDTVDDFQNLSNYFNNGASYQPQLVCRISSINSTNVGLL